MATSRRVRRRQISETALTGYDHGPDAPLRATARQLGKIGDAATLVLVEGVSDQIAVETAAAGRGRDLEAERVVVVPIGGAHATARFLTGLGTSAGRLRLLSLCDVREEELVRRGLGTAPHAQLFVCSRDLEDELIRALGAARVEALIDAQGEAGSFRTLRGQPAWRDRDLAAQIRRFFGSGSRRKSRYARVLVEDALARDVLPRPLGALLEAL
ncbi:TOPRIM nucleotidyl transferase/hydrolase domain-containing protein [Actinoplanes sp. M2I2]|uniref:TOPRIM nucleotidyl transferase/hydrolase domain-containing protein n=1 Tax=Actinoplanes sp. M2I2 TaxID=1734444 RepID=UPI002021E3D7|nr:TOPRIM nucleotidyl transferase/hydrolase domain-containing protein [Actinoplanes sp. M2I2]